MDKISGFRQSVVKPGLRAHFTSNSAEMQTSPQGKKSTDAPVIATNDDAFMCKCAAVERQYYADDFLVAIFESAALKVDLNALRRPPIINRGTFARVQVVQRIVERFLEEKSHEKTLQIISMGAGYDTLSFRLMDKEQSRSFVYIELDFPSVTLSKSKIVQTVQHVSNLFDNLTTLDGECGLQGVKMNSNSTLKYMLYPCELRDLDSLSKALKACEVNFSLPTLFLTECVLMYMDPVHSDSLLRYAASRFTGPRCFVNYEPINPKDPFGRQMVANIAARGSPLLGIHAYPDVQAQKKRFEESGWSSVDALNMLQAFNKMFSQEEVVVLNRREPLDEVEEWNLIMSHYVIVFARSCASIGKHIIFDQ